VIPVDMVTSLYAFQALSSALYARRDESTGRYLDASLLQGGAGLQAIRMMSAHLEGGSIRPGGVPAGIFKTSDGWMSITAIREREWLGLCEALDQPALPADSRFTTLSSRFEHEAALMTQLRKIIEPMQTATLSKRLSQADVMHERVNRYADFLKEPHVLQTEAVAWLSQPDMARPVPVGNLPGMAPFKDGSALATAPRVGHHTQEILLEHGFEPSEIAGLAARGVIELASLS
jgi:crotonobetainyl-CoA:carnitine CoA-transferase CaiB-like acyl-CoA transferase